MTQTFTDFFNTTYAIEGTVYLTLYRRLLHIMFDARDRRTVFLASSPDKSHFLWFCLFFQFQL